VIDKNRKFHEQNDTEQAGHRKDNQNNADDSFVELLIKKLPF
jgi:hypothetical protein